MNLDKLRAIVDAATPGKWSWRGGSLKGPFVDEESDYYGTNNVVAVNYAAQCPHLDVKGCNAAFITTFNPTVVKAMLDVIEAAAKYPRCGLEFDGSWELLLFSLAALEEAIKAP